MIDQSDPKVSPAALPPTRDSDATPFLYFDVVTAYGTYNGAVQIEVASRIIRATPDGGVIIEFLNTAHIRCSPNAATILRNILDAALKTLERPQEGPAVGMGGLN